MNRNIIIVLIIIFLIILAGILAFSQFGTHEDAQITFTSNASLKNGDYVEFQLTDSQGNAIANQNLSISFGTNGSYEHYSIVTDGAGKGALLLNDVTPGNYNVTIKYDGGEQYNECSASQNITIGWENYQNNTYASQDGNTSYNSNNGASTQPSTSSAQSTQAQSSGDTSYDSELNVHYDSNGKVVGGQNDGVDYNELKNNPQAVDEEGNLV
jgi:hypothetical protein